MKRIDHDTVQKIIDATDIVEVVSDFVSLKRRGANYIGLCPFHNERTPSFSVSKSKGLCKCFSCGKGGSAIGFLMEHEQISYYEALRYLAKKYNIEIQERELTDVEREKESEREALMAINEWAMNKFQHNLANTEEGRTIGYSYFVERGINDRSIEKYKLGYAIDSPDALSSAAKQDGYTEKYLEASGLCSRTERGTLYDRFKGRVIYPVFGVSGKVVAFGGRTLKKEKTVAKYVNSPESALYHKSNELYGLFQAKGAIVRKNKCILVEGYMDVISMYQIGIENVVASSGTSLTDGQIRLIHRFTSNVTVIYDSDPAGIKASLRGIDMLLSEGMNVKVLLLPDGDDPDSFAQSHTLEQVERYIDENETDFITFKTRILLQGVNNDPTRRASVISDIIRSIAVIPDAIKRQVYVQECSRMLDMSEKVLSLELSKTMAGNREKEYSKRQRQQAVRSIDSNTDDSVIAGMTPQDDSKKAQDLMPKPRAVDSGSQMSPYQSALMPYEREILRYVLKFGVFYLCDYYDIDDTPKPMSVVEYITSDLECDNISFQTPLFLKVWKMAIEIYKTWADYHKRGIEEIDKEMEVMRERELEAIRTDSKYNDLNKIKRAEKVLEATIEENRLKAVYNLQLNYIGRILSNDVNSYVRNLAADLISNKYKLSRLHTQSAGNKPEHERLPEIVPRAIYELKNKIIDNRISETGVKMAHAYSTGDNETVMACMRQIQELKNIASEYARVLGDRVINPAPIHR